MIRTVLGLYLAAVCEGSKIQRAWRIDLFERTRLLMIYPTEKFRETARVIELLPVLSSISSDISNYTTPGKLDFTAKT